jgi:pimeloyl-ACP methyl ester carboxylesterase
MQSVQQSVPSGIQTECTTSTVKYYNGNDASQNINYFIKRYKATQGKREGAIFMLQGGPGAGGEALEGMGMQLWNKLNGRFDIILPDHRGTARSTNLQCSGNVELPYTNIINNCQTKISTPYTANLDGFTVDQAASDTLNLMRTIKAQSGGLIYLYGVSYGTYISHRMLQMDNSTIDSVVLDGLCGGKYCDFSKADEAFSLTGRDFMTRCGEDNFCKGKLGTPDQILAKMQSLYKTKNECTKMITDAAGPNGVKQVFASWLTDNVARLLVPVFVYRMSRCNAGDSTAMALMILNLGVWQSSRGGGGYGYPISMPINYGIGISELGGRAGANNISSIQNLLDNCVMCTYSSLYYPNLYNNGWKTYPESAYASSWATYNKPILFINGDLDPQTSIYMARGFYSDIQPQLTNSRLLSFKNVVHYVLGRSPMANDYSVQCGLTVVQQFFNQPSNLQTLDVSCMDQMLGLPFAGYSVTDNIAPDMWEGNGLTTTQSIYIAVFSIILIIVILACCLCGITICCYCGQCGCFKPKNNIDLKEPMIRDAYYRTDGYYRQS